MSSGDSAFEQEAGGRRTGERWAAALCRPCTARPWWILAGILLLLFIVGSWIVASQRTQDRAQFEAAANSELQLLAALVRNDLDAGKYQNVITLVREWGSARREVTALRLVTANGYRVADYVRPREAADTLALQTPITYSYRGRATLILEKDRSVLASRQDRLVLQLASGFLVLGLLLGGMIHTLQRHRRMLKALRTRESQLRQAQQELRDYRDHLEVLVAERTRQVREQSLIIDQIHDAVVWTDMDGVVVSWNRGAQRMFGFSAAEAEGRSIAFVYPQQEREFLESQVIAPLLAKGAHEVEVRMQRKDGSPLFAHLSLSLLYDDAGTPRGMVGYSLDITERKRSEALLHEQSLALAAANRELESFAYSVSHDLRAPLRGIDGFSQALLEDYGETLDDTARDYLGRIRAGAQRMGVLIDDLLRLSRLTRAPMTPEQVDLSAMARSVLVELAAAEPGRSVETVVAEGMSARGDPGLMRILLENLLGNAWKYTGRRVPGRIEFGSEQDGGRPRYYVRDNGAGFDMQYVHKLFGAFQRLHHPGEFPGSGIGLATVQRIVHRHGGRVWAEGQVDQGAVFRFVLGDVQGRPGDGGEAQQREPS